jgi:hypothetical protein
VETGEGKGCSLRNRKYGKLGTKQLAIMAVEAVITFDHWRMVSLGIESFGKRQNIPWAVFNTVSASLASLRDDVNSPGGNAYVI